MSRSKNPRTRRAQRVLAMLHELHKRGYQGLGFASTYDAASEDWCCQITELDSLQFNGRGVAAYPSDSSEIAEYSSRRQENCYFGWNDAQSDSARDLAEKFIARFPGLARRTMQTSWVYSGWLTRVVGSAETGALPITSELTGNNGGNVRTTTGEMLPAPPIGKVISVNVGGVKCRYVDAPHLSQDAGIHRAYIEIVDTMVQGIRDGATWLPTYPVFLKCLHTYEGDTQSNLNALDEMAAYWEGCLYYLRFVLMQRNLLDAVEYAVSSANSLELDPYWKVFLATWNSHGQLKWLRAHLTREDVARALAGGVDFFSTEDIRRAVEVTPDARLRWLANFVEQHEDEGERFHNPYFGGSNPLHLGLILDLGVKGDP